MQSNYPSLLQLLFLSTWLVADIAGSGLSCPRLERAKDGETRATFLAEGASGVRSFYLSQWSEDMRLLACEKNTNPVVVKSYEALCGSQNHRPPGNFINTTMLLAPDAPCAPNFQRRAKRDGAEVKTRKKRAWTFPGTLWCGTGSKAAGYEQLGMFESADRCCREHDHCLRIIPAFTINYGVFNPNLFTVSHCGCDQRFRQCLHGVNDTISSMVGYSFFNILRVPCFELKRQRRCTKMYWWGMCKVAKKAPYAVFKSPLSFNTSHTESNGTVSSDDQRATESPAGGQHGCGPRDPPRGDTFYRPRTKGKGCKRRKKQPLPAQIPPTSRAHATTPLLKVDLTNAPQNSKDKKRFGKKKKHKIPTNLHRQTTSTSGPPLTHSTVSQQSTTGTGVIKRRKKPLKQIQCCGSRMEADAGTLQDGCKSCLQQSASFTPATTTNRPSVKGKPTWTTKSPKQDSLTRRGIASAASAFAKPNKSVHKGGKSQKRRDSHFLQNNASVETWSSPAERRLMEAKALHNMTDEPLHCKSLRHLDLCKYTIAPLEKKYNLQNTETKTTYHCDCTSSLAAQIESFRGASVLPALLMDFVSQYCFKLPEEKKCRRRKSCSGGFAKASDLLEALKKIEEKDTAGVRNSGNERKRGNPVRLYKRCLRLQIDADIMAKLT